MRIDPSQFDHVESELHRVRSGLDQSLIRVLYEVIPRLKNERAKEYLSHGVGRRLKLIRRCIDNVYQIWPLRQTRKLKNDERNDLEINLHGLVINVYGILDNLAWVFVWENDLLEKIDGKRRGVGLFNQATQKHLPIAVNQYLNSKLKNWFNNYAKNYRDALAHRIPLYVPPMVLTKEDGEKYTKLDRQIWDAILARDWSTIEQLQDEQDQLGKPVAAFVHSHFDSESSNPVLFHAQVIADAMTVLELVDVFSPHLADLSTPLPSQADEGR